MNKELKAVIAVLMGTGGAQIIALLFMPLLTRLYSPSDFGHLGVFLSIISILTPIAAFTLPMAIVVASNKREAQQLSLLALKFALVCAVLAFIALLVGSDHLTRLINVNKELNYLYWLPLAIYFTALFQVTEYWVIKLERFKLKAKMTMLQSLIINALKLLLGIVQPTALMLIFIAVINPLVNALLLFFPIKQQLLSKSNHNAVTTTSAGALLNKYKDFPLYQAPQATMNAISQSAPVILLAMFFGPVSAGFYSFSRTILAIPVTLVAKGVGDVFYARIAKEIQQQRFKQAKTLFTQSTLLLAAVGSVPLIIILWWGPELFAVTFGDVWQQAGIYAQWLSLWTFFILINAPSLKVLIVLRQQKKSLLINLLTTPIRILALVIGGYYLNSEWLTIKLFVGVSIIHNIIIIGLAYRCLHQKNSANCANA